MERTWQPARPRPAGALTRRELEVVRLDGGGPHQRRDRASAWCVSDHTVHRHVSNILGKLGVRSRAAAASLAAHRGLL